ncbi:hypothetical protein JCM10207_000186 [Rhodosporidiobolus poonsookiae]
MTARPTLVSPLGTYPSSFYYEFNRLADPIPVTHANAALLRHLAHEAFTNALMLGDDSPVSPRTRTDAGILGAAAAAIETSLNGGDQLGQLASTVQELKSGFETITKGQAKTLQMGDNIGVQVAQMQSSTQQLLNNLNKTQNFVRKHHYAAEDRSWPLVQIANPAGAAPPHPLPTLAAIDALSLAQLRETLTHYDAPAPADGADRAALVEQVVKVLTGALCLINPRFPPSDPRLGLAVRTFPPTFRNTYFAHASPSLDFIALGGGNDGAFGLWIDEVLERGWTGRCETFANERLVEGGEV